MDNCHSRSKHAVLHSQINRRILGPIETGNSDPKVAVLLIKIPDEGWDPYRLVILMLITLFCMHKATGEVWDPWRLVILMLITLFCMHKTTGEVWDPWRPVILVLITLFCMHKATGEVWDP